MDAFQQNREIRAAKKAGQTASEYNYSKEQSAIDKKNKLWQYEWDTYQAPRYEEYGANLQSAAKKTADEEIAQAQARTGYVRSAGSGEGGMYDANQLALDRKKQSIMADIAQLSDKFQFESQNAWMTLKDNQQFETYMLALRAKYQQDLTEKQAEINDQSWWEQLASIGGAGLSFLTAGVSGITNPIDYAKAAYYRLS